MQDSICAAFRMITILVHENGKTHHVEALDSAWLKPDSGVRLWVDLADPTAEDAKVLVDYFHFHELAIEDALGEILQPKIESYGTYFYLVLHGIDFRAAEHVFATHEVDFFLNDHYVVTVHDGFSRSITRLLDICPKNDFILGEGTDALLHRIVDSMVDNYAPEVEQLETRIDAIEQRVFDRPASEDIKTILRLKRDVASLRRVVMPQRDVVGRLARREFGFVSEPISYRFRDVYDHLVRLAEEASLFHDRLTGLLDAQLSFTSNRLNEVMKVLTILSTVFMPLTVLTGVWGMNIKLPVFPGSEGAQFLWVCGVMVLTSGALLGYFKWRRWW
jgi:magnesium transporter